MVKSRVFLCKIRYIIFLLLLGLILWQILIKYAVYEVQTTSESLKSTNYLKDLVNKSRVTVSVYYEALCPDSRSFFVRHLRPTFEKMRNGLNIELIPYGKARTITIGESKFRFDCQHGPIECYANKIHACAIHNVEDPILLVNYVTCLIDDLEHPETTGFQCAEKYRIPWKLILNCSKGSQGDWLLRKHGELTNNLNPSISFVPTVLLNQNRHKQTLILKNLQKELCSNYRIFLMYENRSAFNYWTDVPEIPLIYDVANAFADGK